MEAKTNMIKARRTTALTVLCALVTIGLTAWLMYQMSSFPNIVVLGEMGTAVILVNMLMILTIIGVIVIVNLWFSLISLIETMLIKNKVDAIEELVTSFAQKKSEEELKEGK